MNLAFSVGLQEEVEDYPFSFVQPFPLAGYSSNLEQEADASFYPVTTFNALQMVKINNAPIIFNVLLNNSTSNSGEMLLANPVLNIVQLD